jgi:hypothetical protein
MQRQCASLHLTGWLQIPLRFKGPVPFPAQVQLTGISWRTECPILLCNDLPSLADLSRGMMRRLHVLPFDRIFTGGEIDPELFDRMVANKLSGVLNRALEGWTTL